MNKKKKPKHMDAISEKPISNIQYNFEGMLWK